MNAVHRAVLCAAAGLQLVPSGAPCAASPNTFLFEVSNTVTPDQPSATVTLWAAFDPQWFAFRETTTDVLTEFDRGWFSDPIALLDDGWSEAGVVSPDGDRVTDIYIFQVYLLFAHFPDSSNPIAIWSATWTTDEFTPRQVDLATESQSFWVYRDDGGEFDMFGADFAEGSGVIEVVPAPGAAGALTGLGAWISRRQRLAR